VLQNRKAELAEACMRLMSSSKAAVPGRKSGRGDAGALDQGADVFRVGAELREARERLGWALPDVAAGLRIRLPYLEAIEDGRLGELPGNAYAVMFLRTYATALGLDADEAVRRFRAEAAEVNRKTELSFPAPVPERGVPAGALALLGIVLAIGAYAGWYHFTGDRQSVAESVPPVPSRLAALAPPLTPAATPSPQVASVLPTAAPDDPPPPHIPAVPPTQAAAAMPPPMSAAQAQTQAQTPSPASTPAPVQPAASAQPAPPPPAPGQPRIVVRASANSWMQVREKQGAVLLNRVLRPGETWTVPADKPQLLLTTGNAGGTELLVDGVATGPLGNSGAVRRDVPLDPDAIKDGKVASGSTPRTAAQ
jgi:cytoskeleton protein RodZ